MSPMLGPRAINISVVTSMSSDILIYDFMGQPSPLFINFLLFFKLHLTAETVPKTHSENLDRKRRRRSLWPLTIVFDKNGPIRGLFNVHFLSYSNIRGSWHRPDPPSYGGHPPSGWQHPILWQNMFRKIVPPIPGNKPHEDKVWPDVGMKVAKFFTNVAQKGTIAVFSLKVLFVKVGHKITYIIFGQVYK